MPHVFDWSMPAEQTAEQTAEHNFDILETYEIATPKVDPLQVLANPKP